MLLNIAKLFLLLGLTRAIQSQKRPNIVLFLTDDQDIVLDGLSPLSKTRRWFNDGTFFENAFVSTPVCCPSRSSLLTGRYQHNTHVLNNSRSGNCYGTEWTSANGLESRSTIAAILQDDANYETFYAGKYLNEYRGKAIPKGWDFWAGLVGNSRYYNYTINVNGELQWHGDDYDHDYLTDLIGSLALDFLDQRKKQSFLMVLSTPAPHAPFTPAPQYSNAFANMTAPRVPSFNHVEELHEAKHWLVRRHPRPLNETYIDRVDEAFRNRLRTLLSVDEMVDKVMTYLSENDLINDTIAFFTSDHGYHLGSYGLPIDKRMPYDTDIRVPLMIRGPEIAPKSEKYPAVVTIDLAPTFLDIAGLNASDYGMDGTSLWPILTDFQLRDYERDILIEYHGEGGNGNDEACIAMIDDLANLAECGMDWGCKCQDAKNNTYACLRSLRTDVEDFLYCQFSDSENSEEFYDLRIDPYQLHNLVGYLGTGSLDRRLDHLRSCKGHQDCLRFNENEIF